MFLLDKRYAEALLDIANKNNCVDTFYRELNWVATFFNENQAVWKLLKNPEYSHDLKNEVLNDLLSEQIDRHILSFLKLLINGNRIYYFKRIVKSYKALANRQEGVLTVQIFTPFELERQQVDRIKEKYRRMFDATSVKSVINIDTGLIGGIKVKVGDMVFDNSLFGRLQSLLNNL